MVESDVDVEKGYYRQVTDELIDQIKMGIAPWRRSWTAGMGMPFNPSTKAHYQGINSFKLVGESLKNDFPTNEWMTVRQAFKGGYYVRDEEKGTPLLKWITTEERDKKDVNGKPVLDDNGKPERETVKLENPKFWVYYVYNVAQMDGYPQPVRKAPQRNALERAEKILDASKVAIHPGKAVFYDPSKDTIHLPPKEQFDSAERYYDTAMRELCHATGHVSRMNRSLQNPDGSREKAREELRVEIATVMVCEQLGLHHQSGTNEAYTGQWVKMLEEQPKEIQLAATAAMSIYNTVMSYERERTQEHAERRTGMGQDAKPNQSKESAYIDRSFVPAADPRKAFAEFMRNNFNADVREPHPIMNGKNHHIPAKDDSRGKKSIMYRAYSDGVPNGYVKNHRVGEAGKWKATGIKLDPKTRGELAKLAEQKAQQRNIELRRIYDQSAVKLASLCSSILSDAQEQTPYLKSKNVAARPGVLVPSETMKVQVPEC